MVGESIGPSVENRFGFVARNHRHPIDHRVHIATQFVAIRPDKKHLGSNWIGVGRAQYIQYNHGRHTDGEQFCSLNYSKNSELFLIVNITVSD